MLNKTLTIFVLTAIVCLSHLAAAQTSKPESPKNAVKTLMDLTLPSHPLLVSKEEETTLLPKDKEMLEAEARDKQNIVEIFDAALDENKELNAAQKSFVRANYDRFKQIIDKQIADNLKVQFPTDRWVREKLKQILTTKFTNKELNELSAFFQSSVGQRVLKHFKYAMLSAAVVQKGGAPLVTKEEETEAKNFTTTPLAKKFVAAFFVDTSEYVSAKMEAANKPGDDDQNALFALMDARNLNKLFKQFVKDNYKK